MAASLGIVSAGELRRTAGSTEARRSEVTLVTLPAKSLENLLRSGSPFSDRHHLQISMLWSKDGNAPMDVKNSAHGFHHFGWEIKHEESCGVCAV
jgi:hypothetical protein